MTNNLINSLGLHQLTKLSRAFPNAALLVFGLLLMYVPTFWTLSMTGMWADADNSHGPLIFVVAIWLIYRKVQELNALQQAKFLEKTKALDFKPQQILGLIVILIAAVLYVPTRAIGLNYVEVSTFIICLTGVLLSIGGIKLVHAFIFPLLFMIFMIPLPEFLTSGISHLLKSMVSVVTVEALAYLDYPVARSGVIIYVGQYQLLVADACAGMHNLFMLEALGVFYLSQVKHPSIMRNILLPILIIPISFISNVLRVIVLCLITYYFGNEAGQGFLHGFAGIVLFIIGLIGLMMTDAGLRYLSDKFSKKHAN